MNRARLRAVGLSEQALKAAVAAGLAWAIGGYVPNLTSPPYLAPLTAVLTVQLTIAESLAGAAQRTLGAMIGVAVAVLAGNAIGVTPLTIVLLVLVSQAIGAVLRLSLVGMSQVVVTALLVLTVGSSNNLGYGWVRVAETAVGAVVGLIVNALLVPPSHLPAASTAVRGSGMRLRDVIHGLAEDLAGGLQTDAAQARLAAAREVVRTAEETRPALGKAETSLRFNVLAARDRERLESLRRRARALEMAAIQTRTVTRTLAEAVRSGRPAWLDPHAFGQPLANLLRAACGELDDFLEDRDLANARTLLRASRARVIDCAREATSPSQGSLQGWAELGAILATLDRFGSDLAFATEAQAEADEADEAAEEAA